MFELNANFFVVVPFALLGGLGTYLNARRANTPIAPALNKAISMTAVLGALNILWALALNALRLQWNSIVGYGLGLAIGLAGLSVFLALKSLRNRRKYGR